MVMFNSYVSLPQGTPFGCFCASLHCGLTIWISHLSFWSTNHHHLYPGWDRSCFRKRSSQLWFDLEAQWRNVSLSQSSLSNPWSYHDFMPKIWRSGTPYHPFCCQILQLMVKDPALFLVPGKRVFGKCRVFRPQVMAISLGKWGKIDHWIWGINTINLCSGSFGRVGHHQKFLLFSMFPAPWSA